MSTAHSVEPFLEQFQSDFGALRHELARVVVGQTETIDLVLIAAICGGHVLLEGVPGLGKTLLVQTLADVMQLRYSRIQFTPDLMPSDLIGTHVIMETPQGRRTFEFQQGPIFANLVLADQINRGLPKTQSALLQAMEGESISIATETFTMPQPYFVLGTQNPQEMEGTFPLPEPEIDRFFFKLLVKPPTVEEIDTILQRTTEGEQPEPQVVLDGKRLLEMRTIARGVSISAGARRWAAGFISATQPDFAQATDLVKRYVRYGSSPRGAQALVLGAKVHAAAAGRGEVSKDDMLAVLMPALRHRLVLNFEGQAENIRPDAILDSILKSAKSG